MGKIEKIYFDEPSKKEKGAGITASKLPLESDKHHMERLTKMAREKRKKEEKKPPKAPKEFGGKLKTIKGGKYDIRRESYKPTKKEIYEAQQAQAQAPAPAQGLQPLNQEEFDAFYNWLDQQDEGGKLKMKKAKPERKAKEAIKKAIQSSVDKFEFKNVPSEQARVKKIVIEGKEVVDRIPKIEKKPVGRPPKTVDNKPIETATKQFKSIGEQKARLREYKPTRVAELQPSGLPTTEEYQMNPEMFQGLLPEQKYELERQIREKMGKPLMALQDISSEIKKIAPSVTTSIMRIMPPSAGVGAEEGQLSLLFGEEKPKEKIKVEIPKEKEAKKTRSETEITEILRQIKIDEGVTDEKQAMKLFRERTKKNATTKVKEIFRSIASPEEGEAPPEEGSGLAIVKKKGRKTKMEKMLSTDKDEMMKHYKRYMKLKKMKKALTPIQQKKLDKYKEMEGKGLFGDVLKLAKEHGLPLLKKGVQAGVKYAIENPEKVKEYGKKALSFLFKK